MFRPTSPQSSLFEVDSVLPGALPGEDWCFVFRDKVLPLIDEEAFRPLYAESGGRPNASIKTMVSLLIFMGLERVTWRGVEFLFPRRLDWLIATNTAFGEAHIDHTTLFKFYQRLEGNSIARELFTTFVAAFTQACGTSLKKQRTDSFFVHGWLRTLSRYGLFKETITKFLRALRKHQPDLYEDIRGELSQDYLEKTFDLTEKDKELAQRKVALMARDLYRLKGAFAGHDQVRHYETFEILCRVFTQQCQVEETAAQEPEIVLKDKPDTDTICTPHNPQARYIRKVKQRVTGDKAVVTETCDPDNEVQFITDADVVKITTPDCCLQLDLTERLIDNDFQPDKQYGDAGFVTGETILDARDKGIELEGPVAGRSQSLDKYEQPERPLDAADFHARIDPDDGELLVLACPDQQAPTDQQRSDKTGDVLVHFDADGCRACPLAARCPVLIGKGVATLRIDEAQYVGAQRHHQYMEDTEYRKECAVRAGAEACVSELTRAHGARKSRHRKAARTQLQILFAATACNVKRFIRHARECACPELEMA